MEWVLCWFEAHPGTASWAQAIGSILALAVAIGLAYWQLRNTNRTLNRQRNQDTKQLVDGFSAIADYAVKQFNDVVYQVKQPTFLLYLCEGLDAEELRRIVTTIDAFPIFQLPSYKAIETALEIKVLIHGIVRDWCELQELVTHPGAEASQVQLPRRVTLLEEASDSLNLKIREFKAAATLVENA
ncbi:hypothetical protein [Stutzerimonas nitrititolerans]|uniref:hypothetical protein n=1 Tax=Stutzerimonas nitrititolerans TaxID=2482751 RepID=UPI0028A85765|nr:hypothetical protein [Stutzerimonas nitrititolerans]